MTEDEIAGGDDAWIHALFGVMRDEVVAISSDFAPRVKRRIDLVADALGVSPPSAASLLTSVSLETTNLVTDALLPPGDDDSEEES